MKPCCKRFIAIYKLINQIFIFFLAKPDLFVSCPPVFTGKSEVTSMSGVSSVYDIVYYLRLLRFTRLILCVTLCVALCTLRLHTFIVLNPFFSLLPVLAVEAFTNLSLPDCKTLAYLVHFEPLRTVFFFLALTNLITSNYS